MLVKVSRVPPLHENLVVMVPKLLQKLVQSLHIVAVGLQRAGEQHDQVLDPEHEAGVGAVGGVGAEGGHDLGRGAAPHLLQVALGHEAAARVEDVVLALEVEKVPSEGS